MSHANAALTPRARARLGRFVVEQGFTISQAAKRFEVSYRTAKRWADRYRELGEVGMGDRSSRPHRVVKTPPEMVRRIVSLRLRKRLGPVEIGDALAVPASTVYAVLKRCRLNRLSHLDRITGEPIRRYEHERPATWCTSM
jgi:transposase-like protein